jgi:hypothetical protein
LAAEKWTAQAIAQKLDIPLEIAQIAVLNPIGQNIKVPEPDLTALHQGILVSQRMGDFSSGDYIDCGFATGLCKVVIGTVVVVIAIPIKAAIDLWNHFHPAETKDVPKDNGEDQSKDSEKSEKIDPGKTIEKQLQGKGQLKDLRSGRNWDEKISINDALRKTYSELQDMVKNGELSKSGLRRIEKAFEGRDLGKRGKNK